MANIKVESKRPLFDGMAITFKAPCKCNAVEGLTVVYEGVSRNFFFRDTHGTVLTGIGNLFEEGAYVQAILDTVNGYAYLQNADTNSYLESRFWKESDEYPGCYYRIIAGGTKEWQNPPMVANAGYRTAERFDGKPVFVTRIVFPSLKGAGEYVRAVFINGELDRIVSLSITYYQSDESGIIKTYSEPVVNNGKVCASAYVDAEQRLVLQSYDDIVKGYSASCVLKCTLA
jgi:hypothetical protein